MLSSLYSPETALVKVTHDVLMAFNSEVIPMLALSATAVNTVGHNILLQRFKHAMGITGIVLQCFEVYMFNRLQFVYLNGNASHAKVSYGVALGSVLRAVLVLALGNMIRKQISLLCSFIYSRGQMLQINLNCKLRR